MRKRLLWLCLVTLWGCSRGLPADSNGSCVNECQENEVTCTTGGARACGQFDTDSCLDWSPIDPCGAAQKCSSGKCDIPPCVSMCQQQSMQCLPGSNGFQSCEDGNGDGCFEWGKPAPCPDGTTCSDGQCTTTCHDECSEGSTQCNANAVQSCGQFDQDTCLEWGPGKQCSAGESCSQGACRQECLNECKVGQKQCQGNGLQTCGDFDDDPCTEWSTVTPCATGQSCSNGACMETCQDECAAGTARCDKQGKIQTCDNIDDDSCLEWDLARACPSGQTCTAGACSASAQTCKCDLANYCEAAAIGSTDTCSCDPDCGSFDAACSADGHCDTWCPAGADSDCYESTGCSCNTKIDICEPEAYNSASACSCDPDCGLFTGPCGEDGYCDTWCPTDKDPDCSCSCDHKEGKCEAQAANSTTACSCDEDCGTFSSACSSDGYCDARCPANEDADCGCSCNFKGGICEAQSFDSTSACDCDADCGFFSSACSSDGYCDTWCPAGKDTDCGCSCNYQSGKCEAQSSGSTDTCTCDPDCGFFSSACSADSYCDSWCPAGQDPDCQTECSCNYKSGACEASAYGSTSACECDADCGTFSSACSSDSYCDTWCPSGADPDCGSSSSSCTCNAKAGKCEAASYNTIDACDCDPDCTWYNAPCVWDDYCDVWCPTDPDC